ncbi:MAG: amino acid adenylation domain-containing protein, partial [Luteimonas sp.]
AYAHQQVPFEQIVERLQPERSLSHSPLFQIMLILQNNADGRLELPGLTLSPVEQTGAVAKYDLTLNISESVAGLALVWEYSTDLFEAETIARMAGHFETLLNAFVNAPQASVFTADMLGAAERRQLLVEWNATTTDFPRDTCIHALIEAQAAANPDAVAVVFEGEQLSYGELNAKANQLAHYLVTERQVKPDTLVGLCVERSLEMVIGIVGILKAGGAYVPLDPDYPEARLAYMLDDAKLTTVLTQSHVRQRTPIGAAQALCMDDAQVLAQLATQPVANVSTASLGVTASHLAYVIYTSGSTGNPKGVMVEHRALVNRIDWMDRQYRASPSDRILQKTPFSFDVSVWEFMWPLSVGARLVLAKPAGHKDPVYLTELIRAEQITKLHFVPSMLGSMLALGDLSHCNSLKQVFCSGEALTLHHVAQFHAQCPGTELHNLYGPTEAAIDVSFWDCSQLSADLGSVPIGRPIHNIQLYVMDQQLAPQGVAGELHIGGVGLARGYVNRPELTDEKFIANPFYDAADPASSERLYKTGDLVRLLADGNIEYLGRIDHQVKIRGFRIELGEIENALASHALVNEAVVLARDSAAGDKRLLAYVVTSDGVDVDVDELRRHLAASLPEYMVPAAFVVLASLPSSPNGKIDRKALPEPDATQQQAVYVAPATATEKILCAVWEQVLGVERVGASDNFFRLGGHSLLVIQVIARLQKSGVSIAARQLFTTSTLADLAALIDATAQSGSVFRAPPNRIPDDCTQIDPDMLPLVSLTAQEVAGIVAQVPGGAANVQDIYPLASLQEGILFHHRLSNRSDPYVLPMLFSVRTMAQVAAFLEAFQCMIERHDALRTAVLWNDLAAPVQVVYRKATLPVSWLEFGPGQDVQAEMQALCAPEQQWMDLGTAPLVRVRLATDPDSGRHLFLLQLHHLVDDASSLNILQAEVYAFLTGRADTLPAPVAYREFIAHAADGNVGTPAQAFFRKQLGDIEEPTAPFNLRDVQGDGSANMQSRATVPDDVAQALRKVARRMMISPAAL